MFPISCQTINTQALEDHTEPKAARDAGLPILRDELMFRLGYRLSSTSSSRWLRARETRLRP
jgi:hypothetical protein